MSHKSFEVKEGREYDIIVVGGGTTGISAAVAAARDGAKVCIIEYYGFLGGNAATGLPWMAYHNLKRSARGRRRGLRIHRATVGGGRSFRLLHGPGLLQHHSGQPSLVENRIDAGSQKGWRGCDSPQPGSRCGFRSIGLKWPPPRQGNLHDEQGGTSPLEGQSHHGLHRFRRYCAHGRRQNGEKAAPGTTRPRSLPIP